VNLENNLRSKGELSEKQIKEQISDRSDQMLEERAKMIAVTETRNASGAGQQASWEAAMEQGLIPEGARKEWILGWEMACPQICAPMRGKQVGVKQKWELKLPGGKTKEVNVPSEAHPLCRCLATLVIDEDD
jgi:hypothetical protein